jgi:hypothetical protein
MEISHMAHGMSEQGDIAFLAAEGDGLLVQWKRSIDLVGITYYVRQRLQSPNQF